MNGARLKFGPFAFDVASSRLARDDVEIHLTPKAAAVLGLLLQRPGELIYKDEFLDTVWEGVHVREESLTQAISVIRQALGDSAQNPEYIQTVSGEGYRFIGDFQADGAPPADAPVPSDDGRRQRRWKPVAASVGATLVLAAVVLMLGWPLWSSAADPAAIRSLAILPLKHLGDPEGRYRTDAMTDLLSTRLGRIRELTVIPPTSAGRLATGDTTYSSIAATLNVEALIDGSVLWDDGRVRFIVRLVDGGSGEQLRAWEAGPRSAQELWLLQSEMVSSIVEELRLALSPDAERRLAPSTRSLSTEAFDHWAAGTAIAMGRLGEGLEEAIGHFNAALEIEPDLAAAWTGLGISHVQLGTYGLMPPLEAFEAAREAADQAIRIDPAGGEAYVTRGWVHFVHDRDFDRAATDFELGTDLAPSYFGAYHQRAWFEIARGRFEDATVLMDRARRLAPLSFVTHAQSAAPHYFQRDYDGALEHALRAREMNPEFGNAYVQLGRIYLAQGDSGEAIDAFERAQELTPHPRLLGDLALAYGKAGRTADAHAKLRELEAIAATEATYVEPLAFAWAWLGLGDHDRALRWLDEAVAIGGNPLPLLIEWDPKYDPLREDPRFAALIDEVRALRR